MTLNPWKVFLPVTCQFPASPSHQTLSPNFTINIFLPMSIEYSVQDTEDPWKKSTMQCYYIGPMTCIWSTVYLGIDYTSVFMWFSLPSLCYPHPYLLSVTTPNLTDRPVSSSMPISQQILPSVSAGTTSFSAKRQRITLKPCLCHAFEINIFISINQFKYLKEGMRKVWWINV